MSAKISPPILPELIARERLHTALTAHFRKRVTWVGGPAGSGKTTLIASYVRQRERPCVWYKVDGGDNDPASNFHWLTAAVRQFAASGPGAELPVLSPEKMAGLPNFARTFLRMANERLPAGCVLVFDNLQEVDDEAFFYSLIRDALQELTPDKHVVLISRSHPHRLLATFSASRELTVVDWSDLRFTDEEARTLIALLVGRLDRAHADRLQAIADGWAVGLTLLSQCGELPADGVGAGAAGPRMPDVLFDYFATEFLGSLEARLQDFLLRTALAPMLTIAAAGALSGRDDAEGILNDLHRRNLFIVRRDGVVQAYEYHPLFRQFLRARLQAMRPPAEVTDLQRATAEVLETSGDIEASLDLYVELGDWTAIERLLSRYAFELVDQARHRALAHWLRDAPAAVLQERPWLRYWAGVAQMPISAHQAVAALTESYHAFRTLGDSDGAYMAWATTVEMLCNINCYGAELDFWLDEMDALQAAGQAGSDELACRVAASMHAAIAFRRPWHEQAQAWREKALSLSQRTVQPTIQGRIYLNWLQSLMCSGSAAVPGTLALMDGLLTHPKCLSIDRLRSRFAHVARLMFDGEHNEAIDGARAALEFADQEGLTVYKPLLLYFQARAHQNNGQFAQSDLIVRSFHTYQAVLGPVVDPYYLVTKGVDEYLRGDVAGAAASMDAAERAVGGPALTWAHVVVYFVRGQARSELGQHELASQDIAALTGMARRMGNSLQLHHCLLAEAQLAFNRGETSVGLAALRDGLVCADVPLCYLFVWRPAALARLMAVALDNGIHPEAAERIIRGRNLAPPHPISASDRWPRRFRVEMLGGFSLTRDGVSLGQGQSSKIALLQCLIWHGAREVSIDKLADDLWPQKDGDRAENALQVTLLRLRELLGEKRAVTLANRAISLNPALFWSDVDEFRHIVDCILSETAATGDRGNALRVGELQGRLLTLYRGDLLAGGSEALWVRSARRKTRDAFVHSLRRLRSYWVEAGDLEAATRCQHRALAVQPDPEQIRQGGKPAAAGSPISRKVDRDRP